MSKGGALGPGSRLHWFKSSHSGTSGNCAEIAKLDDGRVAVRHSKHPDAAVLIFTPEEWAAFAAGFRDGEFD